MPGWEGERKAAAAGKAAVQSLGIGAMWSWKGDWLRRTNNGHERRLAGVLEGEQSHNGIIQEPWDSRPAIATIVTMGDGRRRAQTRDETVEQ